jgi:predicted secreted protein
MKIKGMLLGCVVLVWGFCAAAAPASILTPTSSKPTNKPAQANGILTKTQPVYSLRLNSNATTGYAWFLVSYPHRLIKVVQHRYVAPKRKMPGAGGYEVWQFKAKKAALAYPQVIQVKMLYARPWEVQNLDAAQAFYLVTK